MPARDEVKVPSTLQTSQSDVSFDKLLRPGFDPIQYLNDSLPTLALTSQNPSTTKQNRSNLLQNTTTDTQSFLAKLNTHSIRSSSDLTTLTDEILRSGNRLAYEVEVLRGDANSLYELLTDTLKDDIAQFVTEEANGAPLALGAEGEVTDKKESADESHQGDPDFIQQLRTLGLVKARLESVIGVFGEGLKWPVAPSEVSVASSLISVSAPELGVVNSAEDDQAREYTRRLRSEITELLDSDGGAYVGLEAATKKVEEFRSLTTVWKGTVEEKARTRVVDGLARLVEDRRKMLDARSAPVRLSSDGSSRNSPLSARAGRIGEGASTAAGLFRRLRDEIYLE